MKTNPDDRRTTVLVRMKTNIGGSRNLEPWPAVGETIDVPDHEAADLIANGYAEEATDDDQETGTDGDAGADGEGDGETVGDGDTQAATDGDTTKPTGRRSGK